jgi:TRAP-type C4-dicarboxylate transport system substrate-binding protein
MKKWGLIFVGILVVVVACLPACQATPEEGKAFRWRLQFVDPSLDSDSGRMLQGLGKSVFERTGGKLLIDVYPGGALGYSTWTHHRVVRDGLVEIGETYTGAIQDDYPEFGVFSQLFLFTSQEQAIKGWEAVESEMAAAHEKFNCKMLASYVYPLDCLDSTDNPFPTLESFKGRKVRAWNSIIAEWLEEIGAVPVFTSYAEAYTALASGVAEGTFLNPRAIIDSGWYDIIHNINTWGTNASIYTIFVNLDAWNQLPKEYQDILMEECAEAQAEQRAYLLTTSEPALQELEDLGCNIVRVPPEELTKAKAAAKIVWERWLATQSPEVTDIMNKVLAATT